MKGALPLLLSLAACSLRDPRTSAPSCASNAQCGRHDVCFLGECRLPAANLSVVQVEVRPPAGSQFGVKGQQLDLSQSVLNDVTLAVALSADGSVTQELNDGGTAPVAGAILTWTDAAPMIPDRVEQVTAVTDSDGGYGGVRISQGSWRVLVQPPAQPPLPLPPLRTGPFDTAAPVLDFVLPRTSALERRDGVLLGPDGGVAGASVTAVDAEGTAISAPSVSEADGGYTLYLPPSPPPVYIQIGPQTDADAGAAAAALDPFPTYPAVPYLASIAIDLPATSTLNGTVLDSQGAPVPAARVYVRNVNKPWTLARSVITNGAGAYAVTLRAGDYVVQAAPSTDANAPALSAQQSIAVPAAGPLNLTCPPKVVRLGQVLTADGRFVGANFQILATRVPDSLVTTRAAPPTATDPNGIFSLVGDLGRWQITVVPPAGSNLPRNIVQVDLSVDPGPSALPAIRISPPLEVVGTVKWGPAPDAGIAGAMVSFFSLDSSGQHTLFLGSALTDAKGRYAAILPDVAQPGIGP
jgi:carboxypeptidase family protein